MRNRFKTKYIPSSMEDLSISDEFKILKAIEKVFSNNHNETPPRDNTFSVTDSANVSLISAKSDFGKKLLLRFLYIDEEGKGKECPTLDYFTKEEIPKAKFSLDYLSNLLDIFRYDDAVEITIKKENPITIENKDFKVILAPRITGED